METFLNDASLNNSCFCVVLCKKTLWFFCSVATRVWLSVTPWTSMPGFLSLHYLPRVCSSSFPLGWLWLLMLLKIHPKNVEILKKYVGRFFGSFTKENIITRQTLIRQNYIHTESWNKMYVLEGSLSPSTPWLTLVWKRHQFTRCHRSITAPSEEIPLHTREQQFRVRTSHESSDGFTVSPVDNYTKSYNKINGWAYIEELLPFKGLSEWNHTSLVQQDTPSLSKAKRYITTKWRDENPSWPRTLPLLIQRQKKGSCADFNLRLTDELLYNYDPFSIKRKTS